MQTLPPQRIALSMRVGIAQIAPVFFHHQDNTRRNAAGWAVLAAGVVLAVSDLALGQATTNPAPASSGPAAAKRALPTPTPPRRGWWNDAVFYEVFVRSFADSTKGDGGGPLAGDGIGDFNGLREKLDYLRDADDTTPDLGIDALWLMPIHPSPSYHGYDATDYLGVHPQYGTMDDFKALVAACHARGIRVIIDLVLNHHSSRHEWFTGAADPASPRHRWYVWAYEDQHYRGPWGQTVWHSTSRVRAALEGVAEKDGAKAPRFYYGIFNHDMPDLNYQHEAVTKAMKAVAKFWLVDVGIDGFRLDAIRHLIEDGPQQENTPATYAWLAEFRAYCHELNPDAFIVGEVWSDSVTSASYVGPGMESTFDFALADAIVNAVSTGDPKPLARAIEVTMGAYPRASASTFLANHDQPRVVTQLARGGGGSGAAGPELAEGAALAASILLTLPGTPFLYYGEEIGMTGDKPDPRIRTPMRWTPAEHGAGFTTGKAWQELSKDAARVNVETQLKDPASLLNVYRRMVALRRAHPALRADGLEIAKGTPTTPTPPPGVLAFLRRGEGLAESALVVVNLRDRPAPEFDWLPPAGVGRAGAELVHGKLTAMEGERDKTDRIPATPARSVRVYRVQ